MVRSVAVTQEEVSQLAKDLIGKGERPTIGRIRELLGNRGSPNTISRFLKAWRDGEITQIRQESDTEEVGKPQKVETKSFHFENEAPQETAVSVSKPAKAAAFGMSTPEVVVTVSSPAPAAVTTPVAPAVPETTVQSRPQQQQQQSQHQGQSQNQAQNQTQNQTQNQAQNQGQGHPHRRDKYRDHHKNPGQGPKPHQHGGGQTHHQHPHQHQPKKDRPPVQKPVLSFEDTVPNVYVSENLDTLTTTQLMTKVRRLESILNKEVSRRERADSMAKDAKEYAEAVKDQVGARINDIRQSMEMVIDSLQSQLKSMRENAEKDLRYYREALQRTHDKLTRR